jgi:hypothetical protein
MVLKALAESVIVVVPIEYTNAPTVLTVRVPPRNLQVSEASWKKPATWLIKPSGHLEIDVLLPTADADRQIQVNLPAGVSLDEPAGNTAPARGEFPHLDIAVGTLPPSLLELSVSMEQISLRRNPGMPARLVECLVDLAREKLAAALDTLQHYEASRKNEHDPNATAGKPHAILTRLTEDLDQLRPVSDAARARLIEFWELFRIKSLSLSRRTLADRPSAQTVVARADMIEDVSQRATPEEAKLHVDVTVDDRDYFSIARSSASMSLILMIGVLCFLLFWPATEPHPEVLAIVLTLFATIQASRIERPDRSTLLGLLSAAGNWLIASSMLPPVTLAVVLAFHASGSVPAWWAVGCIVFQAFLLVIMRYGPLTPAGSFSVGQRRTFKTDPLNYSHFEALRSGYWRSTTADALMIGRAAYGYVTWQETDGPGGAGAPPSPQLESLLARDGQSAMPKPAQPNSVLALLHSSTLRQAVTFLVFRERPGEKWSADAEIRKASIRTIAQLDLDPDRLAPMDNVTSTVDIFVGVPCDQMPTVAAHPLTAILRAARNKLIVLEAQLPIPAPVDDYYDRHWARIRVALRDTNDIRRLSRFLGAVYDEVAQTEDPAYVVAVHAVPTGQPRLITGPRERNKALLLTGDLDVSHIPAIQAEPADARTWRMTAICADARSNVENDILQHLPFDPSRFQLAHLNYALLHGTAVAIMLVHEIPGPPAALPDGQAGRFAGPDGRPSLGQPHILIDEETSLRKLGPTPQYPLLRVRYRWRDMPGAFLNVLSSVSDVLASQSPPIRAENVSYARLQVATGQVALGYLTMRIHAQDRRKADWNSVRTEQVGRTAGSLAARKAVTALDSGLPADSIDNPVIRLDLISKDLPRSRSRTGRS